MIHRARSSAGCMRDSVTVPITSAMRMAVQLRQGAGDASGTVCRTGGCQEHHLLELEKGEKGLGDGSCSYGLSNGEDIYMSDWNGTIIEPTGVSYKFIIQMFNLFI